MDETCEPWSSGSTHDRESSMRARSPPRLAPDGCEFLGSCQARRDIDQLPIPGTRTSRSPRSSLHGTSFAELLRRAPSAGLRQSPFDGRPPQGSFGGASPGPLAVRPSLFAELLRRAPFAEPFRAQPFAAHRPRPRFAAPLRRTPFAGRRSSEPFRRASLRDALRGAPFVRAFSQDALRRTPFVRAFSPSFFAALFRGRPSPSFSQGFFAALLRATSSVGLPFGSNRSPRRSARSRTSFDCTAFRRRTSACAASRRLCSLPHLG